MGPRRQMIVLAAVALAKKLGGHTLLSDYVESEPWGFESQRNFLNRGILVITPKEFSPDRVLDIAQHTEKAIGGGAPHRNADGTYCDRPLDIDIIDIDGTTVSTPRLTLPHPGASTRPFVMEPMRQLEKMYNESTAAIDANKPLP